MDKQTSLSLKQLSLPVIPLVCFLVFDAFYHPELSQRVAKRELTFTFLDDAGKVTRSPQKGRHDVPVIDIDWKLGPIPLFRETETAWDTAKVNSWLPQQLRLARTQTSLIVFSVALLAAALLAYQQRWHDRHDSRPALMAPSNALLISVVVVIALSAVAMVAERWVTAQTEEISATLKTSFFSLTSIGVLLVAPIHEELVFRTCLQRVANRWMPTGLAIVLQAACFAACHPTNWLHLSIAFFGGLGFGIIYAVAKRIWVSMVVHAVANAISIFLIL